jgi:rod shape determining protein RodA
MSYRRSKIRKTIDWPTLLVYLILVIAGWFSIYAASYDFDQISMFDLSGRAGKQMAWIGAALLLGGALLMIEDSWYELFSIWIYALIIVLLLVTLLIAPEIKGSRSWLVLGPVSVQPAEFAKFATALAVARIMSTYRFSIKHSKNFILLVSLILLPLMIILLQNETGTALVFLAFFLVLYREGMSGSFLFLAFCAVLFFVIGVKFGESVWLGASVGKFAVLTLIIIFANCWLYDFHRGRVWLRYMTILSLTMLVTAVVLAHFFPFNINRAAAVIAALMAITLVFLALRYWTLPFVYPALFIIGAVAYLMSVDYVFDNMLQQHQRTRIKVALGMIEDPRGVGYNVNQSIIAIGSGGVFGKGFLNGTQTKLKYVPEQDTDFIFCTVGEEKGFIGSAAVLTLFLALILRIIFLAERQRSTFNRVYGYCVAGILFFHVAINIGMVTGITPVIGIPLPFFSYGGSSLWSFTTLLFIFLRLDASRGDRL